MLEDFVPALFPFPAAPCPCPPSPVSEKRGTGNKYDIGSVAILTATFKNSSGLPQDPSTVTLRVRDPNDEIATYTYQALQITRVGVGVYSFNLPLPLAGTWFYRFEGSGWITASADSYLQVTRSETLGY
jgi:hypothetical protein